MLRFIFSTTMIEIKTWTDVYNWCHPQAFISMICSKKVNFKFAIHNFIKYLKNMEFVFILFSWNGSYNILAINICIKYD